MTTISTSPPSSANPPGDLPAVRAVAQRLVRVRQRIENAGGDPERVRIIGVTKGFGPPVVGLARAAGLRDLGENYAAELVAKAASQGEGPGASKSVAWHFLGAVQQNKVARLAPLVALWQSVAREVEGARIARSAPGAAVLVQVETTGLPGRNGCAPAAVGELVGKLRALGLDVRGLMTVAAPGLTAARASFESVRRLADDLELEERSMGMSEDLEAAVAAGSTMVRIGRALFGERATSGERSTSEARPMSEERSTSGERRTPGSGGDGA